MAIVERVQQEREGDPERWGTIFMGPTSDRESSIDKVTNREQCDLWNRQAEAEYMARVRARAALRVEAMLDKARTNSGVIRRAAQEWAEKVRQRWEDLHTEARHELEQARQLREEAEQLRENAYAEGYQMGVEQAMMELDAHRAELDGMTSAVLTAIQGQCPSFYATWREALSGLLREAVETSVGWVLTEERAAVLEALLTASVQVLENRQRLMIRVHPDDEAALQTVITGAKERFDEVRAWEVTVDPALHPGSLVVESASGKVDNLAENRFGTVEQVLRHLTLPHGPADEAAVAAVADAARTSGLPNLQHEAAERQENAAHEEAERLEAEQATAEAERTGVPVENLVEEPAPDLIAKSLERLAQLSEAVLESPVVQPWLGEEALHLSETDPTYQEMVEAVQADKAAEAAESSEVPAPSEIIEATTEQPEAALPPAGQPDEAALPPGADATEEALPPGLENEEALPPVAEYTIADEGVMPEGMLSEGAPVAPLTRLAPQGDEHEPRA